MLQILWIWRTHLPVHNPNFQTHYRMGFRDGDVVPHHYLKVFVFAPLAPPPPPPLRRLRTNEDESSGPQTTFRAKVWSTSPPKLLRCEVFWDDDLTPSTYERRLDMQHDFRAVRNLSGPASYYLLPYTRLQVDNKSWFTHASSLRS